MTRNLMFIRARPCDSGSCGGIFSQYGAAFALNLFLESIVKFICFLETYIASSLFNSKLTNP